MKSSTFKLSVVFNSPILGSQSTKEITSEFIAGKAGLKLPADEEKSLPDELERGTTVFHRGAPNDNVYLLFDYHLKGFLKEAAKVFNGKVAGGVKNLKSKVSSTVFVTPRRIALVLPKGCTMHDYLERPLRAETAMGPRVALVRSEMLPEGTSFSCGIEILPGDITEEILRELLDYGYHQGLGQWRNGGWGTFRYTLVSEDAEEAAPLALPVVTRSKNGRKKLKALA